MMVTQNQGMDVARHAWLKQGSHAEEPSDQRKVSLLHSLVDPIRAAKTPNA